MNLSTSLPLFKKSSQNYIQYIENKFLKNLNNNLFYAKIQVGNIIRISYLIPEGNKERIQSYEGIVIAQQNRGIKKTFTLRRIVQNVGVEQIFCLYSPKIVDIKLIQESKIRRAKLYFLRSLKGKLMRLKRK